MIHRKFALNTGTLLIQFYDAVRTVRYGKDMPQLSTAAIDFNNSRHLRNAVISILDKYRFWAEGFMEGATATAQEKDL